MRWLFVLMVVLNGFYFIWSHLEAPVKPKEVAGRASSRPAGQDIRLLSESQRAPGPPQVGNCLYLGGFAERETLSPLLERLAAARVEAAPYVERGRASLHWARVAPSSRESLSAHALSDLSRDIKDLKDKIMPCEGIATAE